MFYYFNFFLTMPLKLKSSNNKLSPSQFPIKPILAARIEKPFKDEDWIFEVKLDGYRIISEVMDNRLHFFQEDSWILQIWGKIKWYMINLLTTDSDVEVN